MKTIDVKDNSLEHYGFFFNGELMWQDQCEHLLESDVMDIGDDGEGYYAYDIMVCLLCGKTWSISQYREEFSYDEDF